MARRRADGKDTSRWWLLAAAWPAACAAGSPSSTIVDVPPARSAAPEPEPEPEPEVETLPPIEGTGTGSATVRTHEPSPKAQAEQHLAKCRAGDAVHCHAAALDAYYQPASPETDAAARDLFEQACKAGYAPSCNGLGTLHAQGRGVPKDEQEAARLYELACHHGASTGCQHLAQALRAGRGVPIDLPAAERAEARGKCVFEASLKKVEPSSCPGLDARVKPRP